MRFDRRQDETQAILAAATKTPAEARAAVEAAPTLNALRAEVADLAAQVAALNAELKKLRVR